MYTLLKQMAQAALLLLTTSSLSFGQANSGSTKVYGTAGGGAASHKGTLGELGLQAVWEGGLTTTFSHFNLTMEPKNMPSDYKQGYTIIIFFPLPDPLPETSMEVYSFTAGKSFEAGRSLWFTAEGGLSVTKGDQYTFRPQRAASDGFFYQSSNYTFTKEEKTAVGAMLRADMVFAFSSFAGIGWGVHANLNSVQSSIGSEIKLVLGWMNRKPRKVTAPK